MGRIQGTDWGQDVLEWALLCGSQASEVCYIQRLFSLVLKHTFDWGQGKAAYFFSFTSLSGSLVGSCSRLFSFKRAESVFWDSSSRSWAWKSIWQRRRSRFHGKPHDSNNYARPPNKSYIDQFESICKLNLHMGHLGATLDSRWFTTFFLFCADTGLGTSCFGRVEFGTEKTQLRATCWTYCTWFRGHKVIVKTFAQHHTQ